MPLSDEERRRLEKLEQDLAASDPDLNLELQSGEPRGMVSRAGFGILAMLAGFALVIAGIIIQITVIGVIGFVLMSAGAHWFLSGLHLPNGPGFLFGPHGQGTSSASGPGPGTT